jgi:oxygen-independent coproporphyrinogen III oxidase
MSGIYIHIPYCKKACNYCDFHFSVSMRNLKQMVNTICSEAALQKDYLYKRPVKTLYFGGGTPSVLKIEEIDRILSVLNTHYTIERDIEFTFETNPDDLTPEYLKGLRSLGVNRLSIGTQSFFDEDLRWMNRRHNASDAIKSIKTAQDSGFYNINIDLIYGLPISSMNRWTENLEIFRSLSIPHLSAYHLTIEPKTILGVMKKKGKIHDITEEDSIQQYHELLNKTEAWGYQNYEISNFCLEGYTSSHNLNYWNQGHYLGLGPSAHSFNGKSRQWNLSVNQYYLDAIEKNEIWYEKEDLTVTDSFNDYLLTRLRTMWGIQPDEIREQFGEKLFQYINREIRQSKYADLLEYNGKNVWLTKKGKFVSNRVISDLMFIDA